MEFLLAVFFGEFFLEFLLAVLKRHLAGKPEVASPNVGYFLRVNLLRFGFHNQFPPITVPRYKYVSSSPPKLENWDCLFVCIMCTNLNLTLHDLYF